MGSGRAWAQRSNQTSLDYEKDQEIFWTADRKTCVAPVKLKPNKTYEVLMNFEPFIGFTSEAGVPSMQFSFTFQTGGGPVTEDARSNYAEKNLTEESNSPGSAATPKSAEHNANDSEYVDAELEHHAHIALKTMAERCKFWLLADSDDVETWSYHFKCSRPAQEDENREIDISITNKGRKREKTTGTTYITPLQQLAALAMDDDLADQIRFKSVNINDKEVTLHFIVPDKPLRYEVGNGMSGSWLGYFSMSVKEGQLILDRKTLLPKLVQGVGSKIAERFSNYVKTGEGTFAPKRIRVLHDDMIFDMQFKIWQPGLWLLDKSSYIYDEEGGKYESTVEISDVKINNEPAAEMTK